MSERDSLFHRPDQNTDPMENYLKQRINTLQSSILTAENLLVSTNKLRILKRRNLKRKLSQDKKSLQNTAQGLASYELEKTADTFSDLLK